MGPLTLRYALYPESPRKILKGTIMRSILGLVVTVVVIVVVLRLMGVL